MRKMCILLLTVFIFSNLSAQTGQEKKIVIAAASDLKFALDSIVAVFKNSHEGMVDVIYGSSGKLFEQISNGAPFHLYFSADINYPKLLKEKGLVSSEIYPYGVGRIVIWSKKIDPQKDGIQTLLSPSIKKIAIANPAHAPYGKRAEESMNYYNILSSVREKLVLGENISQTAQFVTTGAADIGIVALSLALSPNMKKEGGKYFIIPENSHNPLEQGAVITRFGGGNRLAEEFMNFIKGTTANDILTFYGFTRP